MHKDIGVINGPVLLFGGPYSNLQATNALLAHAADLGVPASSLVCTGDIIAYCADPVATLTAIRESGATVVAGNCEKQLATAAAGCGCGFEAGSTCDLLSAGWYNRANELVGPDDRIWMSHCPDTVSFQHNGKRYGVIHGGVGDIARFIWPVSEDSIFVEEWMALEAQIGPVDTIIAGHCGIPFVRDLPKGRWINAGVIGMPPHDGALQTRYALLQNGEVSFHLLDYDNDTAIAAMTEAGLTQGYHHALKTGYWPSEDVLPAELRVSSLASG